MQIRAEYEYHIPSDIASAKALILKGAAVMAGGSDVMPQLKMNTICPKDIVDLAHIKALQGFSLCDEAEGFAGIRIGAMTTLDTLAKDPIILKKAPLVSRAARNVASPQIRNRGTIGGNLLQSRRCFYYNQTKEWRSGIPVCRKLGGDICLQIPKSPVCKAIYYSDMAPVLIACDALVCIDDANGERLIPVSELVSAHCEDRLDPCLIKEIILPEKSYCGPAAGFMKYSLRGSIDFPIVNFACSVHSDNTVRFAAGAIASHVIRLEELEAYLAQNGPDFDAENAAVLAEEEMKKKCELIRESGLTVGVKRISFKQVHEILEQISSEWRSARG